MWEAWTGLNPSRTGLAGHARRALCVFLIMCVEDTPIRVLVSCYESCSQKVHGRERSDDPAAVFNISAKKPVHVF